MIDANGNFIPDPWPPVDPMRQQQPAQAGVQEAPEPPPPPGEPAGGMLARAFRSPIDDMMDKTVSPPPAAPPQAPPAPAPAGQDYPPAQARDRSVPDERPSDAQFTLADRDKIRTYGPAADAQKAAIGGYQAEEQGYANSTGQGRPQSFGTEEPARPDEGPLTPQAAAEAYMKANPTKEAERHNVDAHSLGPKGGRLQQNADYQARVDSDDEARRARKERLAEQGDRNRARSRDKDLDMWSQFRDLNGLQGGNRNNGGITVDRVGGYAFVGPNAGTRPYGGRGGLGHFDPFEEQKVDIRRQELERLRNRDATGADLAGRRLALGAARNEVAANSVANAMQRFNVKNGQQVKKTAQESLGDFSILMADYDRRLQAANAAVAAGGDNAAKLRALNSGKGKPDPLRPGKIIPDAPEPGGFDAIQRRIIDVATELNGAHDQGAVDFQVTPEVMEKLKAIYSNQQAAKRARPVNLDQAAPSTQE